jgi:hypothetical protein
MRASIGAAGLVVVCGISAGVSAQTILVPAAAGSASGSGAYSTLLNNAARSYQLVIGEPELNGRIPVGARITAIQWRNASWQAFASWPPVTANFANFDLYLAQSTVTPGNLSLTDPMSNAGPDLLQVRGGPITFAPGYFPGGAVSPSFNPLCAPIVFTTPYTYQGGPLLLMVRHTGSGVGSGSLDWVASSFGSGGAQAIAVSSYTSNTGWGGGGNGGAIVVQFTFEEPAACYANCDGSTSAPVLNVLDFNCFINRFSAGETYANCDGSTSDPVLNVLDFNCFLNSFSAGCP